MNKHVRMKVVTPKGREASITGDPAMSQKTKEALLQMMDMLVDFTKKNCTWTLPKKRKAKN
jgi:hypothetical protein